MINSIHMNQIIHLDCSLRDGGYYNNWDFSDELINDYLQVLGSINVDFCEVGFRFAKNSGFKGSCAFTSEEFLNSLDIPENLKIAIMINASEFIQNNTFNRNVSIYDLTGKKLEKLRENKLNIVVDQNGIIKKYFYVVK